MTDKTTTNRPAGGGIHLGGLRDQFEAKAGRKRPLSELRSTATDAPPATPAPVKTSSEKPAAKATKRPPVSEKLADDQLQVRRTIYVAEDLANAVSVRCARDKVLRTSLVLAAINATHKRLSELIAADAQRPPVAANEDDLFAIPEPVHPRNLFQIPITPTKSQIATIDRLVEVGGARDRSHMLSVVLREYLRDDLQ